ncbi:TRAF-like protein [Haematococcus lacustris]
MSKKTTYNVDLTVQALPESLPRPPQLNSTHQHTQHAAQADIQQAASSGAATNPKSQHDKKGSKPVDEGRKSKRKGKHSSSSEDSDNSSSSSDSDAEHYSVGVARALQPWRYPYYCPSASYRQLDLVAGSHQYTISGFSLARALGCGTRLCSDLFEVAGQAFRLEVYPAGCTADTRSYVSAFLTTPGSLNPNHVLYEVAVIDQSGRDKHVVASRGAEAGRCRPLLSQCRGIVAALPKLVKARLLEDKARRYLPDDMLVLRATVQVVRGWSSPPALHTHLAAQAQGPAPHLMQQPGYGPAGMGWAAGQPALPSNVLVPPGQRVQGGGLARMHGGGPCSCRCGMHAHHPQGTAWGHSHAHAPMQAMQHGLPAPPLYPSAHQPAPHPTAHYPHLQHAPGPPPHLRTQPWPPHQPAAPPASRQPGLHLYCYPAPPAGPVLAA